MLPRNWIYIYLLSWLVAIPLNATNLDSILKRYVASPAPYFKVLSQTETHPVDQLVEYQTQLQTVDWLTAKEVDRTIWQHNLTLYVPVNPKGKVVFLFISGGNKGGKRKVPAYLKEIAQKLNCVVGMIDNIPNQPLTFSDNGHEKVEDDLLAYGLRRFFETNASLSGKPTLASSRWIPHLAMVKSVTLAMNYIEQLVKPQFTQPQFILSGASKRGWTTWLTAAIDKRVKGIVPRVFDALNLTESLAHHHDVYGFWAAAVQDYERHQVFSRIGTPLWDDLVAIIDPLKYNRTLTLPKMIVNAANDQFFLPDSSQFYYPQLTGAKYLRYVPNVGHGLGSPDVVHNMAALIYSVQTGRSLPSFSWSLQQKTQLSLDFPILPSKIIQWEAVNPLKRDFRQGTGYWPVYQKKALSFSPASHLVITIARPEKGWKAFFIEVHFPLPDLEFVLKLTTSIYVIGSE